MSAHARRDLARIRASERRADLNSRSAIMARAVKAGDRRRAWKRACVRLYRLAACAGAVAVVASLFYSATN